MLGGIARRVRWIRENVKKDSPSVLLEAGDSLFKHQREPTEGELAKAGLLLDFYKEMGYAALAVGYRDLAASLSFYKNQINRRGLTALSANLRYKAEPPFAPYQVVQTGRTTLGILALTGPLGGGGIKTEELRVVDPVSRLQELIPEVADKARIIVLLSNQGYGRDRELASRVKEIDIIIGGGSGKPLYKPARIGQTYFLRAHTKGKSIGAAELTIDENGRLESLQNRLILLRENLPEDEKAAERVAKVAGTREATDDAAAQQPAAENPFLKILQKRMKKQPPAEQTESQVQPQKSAPQSGEKPPNPLLELLKRLQEEQKKKSGQEGGAKEPKAQ